MRTFLKVSVFYYIFFSVFLSITNANTTRDLGQEPQLESKNIAKWIIFYTNIERLKHNREPLSYDLDLEKAAQWQAKYCVSLKKLSHSSKIKGMRKINDRVEHFGSKWGACGENLTIKFSINSEGVPYIIKNDKDGEYFDYGKYTVNWRNEQQLGFSMVQGWMKSPGHRKNILKNEFNWIGAGAVKGIYNKNKSYYGCQVFNGYGVTPKNYFKQHTDLTGLNIIKSLQNGVKVYTLAYNGELESGVIEVNKDSALKSRKLLNNGERKVFVLNASFTGQLYAALYDKKFDVVYPIKLLK